MPEDILPDNSDPWVDDETMLARNPGPPENLADLDPESTPEPENEVPPQEAAFAEPEEKEKPRPQVFTYEDGTRATVEKTDRGWKATLESGVGNPEVFYGPTKEKMYERIVSAKIEATKTIRSKNREIRLSTGAPNAPEPIVSNSRTALTADEVNSLKLQFAENPEQAIDSVIKRKTGKTLEELAQDSNEGKRARQELEAEATGREFVENTPEYYPTRANYESIVKWISRYKMNRICNESNFGFILGDIYDRGLWNIPGIIEAFEDLRDNGLLDLPPLKPSAAIASNLAEEEPEEIEEPQELQVVRRPRPAAGLGIRASEARGAARNTAPEKTTVTQQDLDNLSDKEIEVLMAQMRKQPREAIKESLERSRSK